MSNFKIENISLYFPFPSPITKNISKKITKNMKNKPIDTISISILESIITCDIFVNVFNKKCSKIEFLMNICKQYKKK